MCSTAVRPQRPASIDFGETFHVCVCCLFCVCLVEVIVYGTALQERGLENAGGAWARTVGHNACEYGGIPPCQMRYGLGWCWVDLEQL